MVIRNSTRRPQNPKDITGQVFGRLTALQYVETRRYIEHWKCQCSCGKHIVASVFNLKYEVTKSCGCLWRDKMTKHGMAPDGNPSRTYKIWSGMNQRCVNANGKGFKYYGGRGITVCERWKDSFLNFYVDMGECPSGMSLERKNNNGNYEPDNCKWAIRREQNRNHRRNHNLTFNGKTMCLTDWAIEINVSRDQLWGRLRKGWPIELALTLPPKSRWRKHVAHD